MSSPIAQKDRNSSGAFASSWYTTASASNFVPCVIVQVPPISVRPSGLLAT